MRETSVAEKKSKKTRRESGMCGTQEHSPPSTPDFHPPLPTEGGGRYQAKRAGIELRPRISSPKEFRLRPTEMTFPFGFVLKYKT